MYIYICKVLGLFIFLYFVRTKVHKTYSLWMRRTELTHISETYFSVFSSVYRPGHPTVDFTWLTIPTFGLWSVNLKRTRWTIETLESRSGKTVVLRVKGAHVSPFLFTPSIDRMFKILQKLLLVTSFTNYLERQLQEWEYKGGCKLDQDNSSKCVEKHFRFNDIFVSHHNKIGRYTVRRYVPKRWPLEKENKSNHVSLQGVTVTNNKNK